MLSQKLWDRLSAPLWLMLRASMRYWAPPLYTGLLAQGDSRQEWALDKQEQTHCEREEPLKDNGGVFKDLKQSHKDLKQPFKDWQEPQVERAIGATFSYSSLVTSPAWGTASMEALPEAVCLPKPVSTASRAGRSEDTCRRRMAASHIGSSFFHPPA